MLNRNTVYRFAIASVGVLLLLAACEEAPVPKHDSDHNLRPDIVVRDIKFQGSDFRLRDGGYIASRNVEGMTAEWFEHGEVSAYFDLSGGEEFSGVWVPTPVVLPVFPAAEQGEEVTMLFLVAFGSIVDNNGDEPTYGIRVIVTYTGPGRPDPMPQTFEAGYIKVRVVYDPGRAVTE